MTRVWFALSISLTLPGTSTILFVVRAILPRTYFSRLRFVRDKSLIHPLHSTFVTIQLVGIIICPTPVKSRLTLSAHSRAINPSMTTRCRRMKFPGPCKPSISCLLNSTSIVQHLPPDPFPGGGSSTPLLISDASSMQP